MDIKFEQYEVDDDVIDFCAICEDSIDEGKFLAIRINNLDYPVLCRSCIKQLARFFDLHKVEIQTL